MEKNRQRGRKRNRGDDDYDYDVGNIMKTTMKMIMMMMTTVNSDGDFSQGLTVNLLPTLLLQKNMVLTIQRSNDIMVL